MKLLFLFLVATVLSSCAGSGPGGSWTTTDYANLSKGLNDGVDIYQRVRYPDRPMYPYPVYPPQP